MRAALVLAFLANLALAMLALTVGPEKLATHFGAGGEPDGWSSGTANALMMGGISLLLFVMFYGAPNLLRRIPDAWINLPHREYWLAPQRREHTVVVMARELYAIGAATFALMFVLGTLALQANLSDPVRLRMDWTWGVTGLYLAYTVYWCVKLYLGFRLPTSPETGDAG